MTHQPKGSMCISCGNANASCASRPFASMPVIKTYPDGVKAVKCTGHVHAQASTEKNEALQQVLVAALEEARSAINSMKVEAETAGQGDEQMMLEACETISNEGLQADMAIRAALASAPKPSFTPQADSQPAPVQEEEREAFKAAHRHLELDEVPDAWGRPMFKYSHVEASWLGWIARAARAPADSALEDAARLERERICAAIKAEDDYCVDHGDYMLDSDDCIKIVRGEWVRPDFSVVAARKQGENHDHT